MRRSRSLVISAMVALVVVGALSSTVTAATCAVTWDRYSWMIDGQRTFPWSGEFHPFRLPSPSPWRSVPQTLKASGYNAVSLYFDWRYRRRRVPSLALTNLGTTRGGGPLSLVSSPGF